ncbi:hypothetical protein ACFL0W_01455, partial [Nanoarchaeota archaeon]
QKFSKKRLYFWNFTLFVPLAILRIAKRNSKPQVDQMRIPKFLNSLFYLLLKIENKFIKYGIPFPFGLSIVGSCKK